MQEIDLKKKNKWKGVARAGKRFTIYISNIYVNDIIKIIKSIEDSGVLIDGVTEIVKHVIKNKRCISWSIVSTFSQKWVYMLRHLKLKIKSIN